MKKNIFLTKSKLFQKQTKKDWKNLNSTEGSLNNNDKNTYDPIYFQEENSITNTFNKNGKWDICVEIDIKTEKQANKDALKALKYGANSISFLNFSNQKLSLILKNIHIKKNKKDIKYLFLDHEGNFLYRVSNFSFIALEMDTCNFYQEQNFLL